MENFANSRISFTPPILVTDIAAVRLTDANSALSVVTPDDARSTYSSRKHRKWGRLAYVGSTCRREQNRARQSFRGHIHTPLPIHKVWATHSRHTVVVTRNTVVVKRNSHLCDNPSLGPIVYFSYIQLHFVEVNSMLR